MPGPSIWLGAEGTTQVFVTLVPITVWRKVRVHSVAAVQTPKPWQRAIEDQARTPSTQSQIEDQARREQDQANTRPYSPLWETAHAIRLTRARALPQVPPGIRASAPCDAEPPRRPAEGGEDCSRRACESATSDVKLSAQRPWPLPDHARPPHPLSGSSGVLSVLSNGDCPKAEF